MTSAAVETFESTLNAPLPEEWFAKESITLLAPDGQANVIASSEPLDASIDTKRYAEVQGELLRQEFPGYREFVSEPARAFGNEGGILRKFEWLPPDGVLVTQLQVYYAENGRGFTGTATSPATEFPRYERELRRILEGLTFGR